MSDRARRLAAHRRGIDAESRVAGVLGDAGWTVLARNWRGGGGELDLVVTRDGAVRLVEVKLRELGDARADEAVPQAKRRRLRGAALAWLQEHPAPREVCFLLAWVDVATGEVVLLDDPFDLGS